MPGSLLDYAEESKHNLTGSSSMPSYDVVVLPHQLTSLDKHPTSSPYEPTLSIRKVAPFCVLRMPVIRQVQVAAGHSLNATQIGVVEAVIGRGRRQSQSQQQYWIVVCT